MIYLEFNILGVVQGITEFLPISSSGHLLIGRTIFSIESDVSSSFIEVILHGGTLLAILLFWKKDILDDIKDTLRNKYGISIDKNSVHGSDSIDNAIIEIDFFFKN